MHVMIVHIGHLEDLIKKYGDDILIFNPYYIFSKEQAAFAAKLALKAMENGQNIAKKLPIEFLVRLSGEKQISKALKLGLDGLKDLAGIVILKGPYPKDMEDLEINTDHNLLIKKYNIKGDNIKEEIWEKMALVDL